MADIIFLSKEGLDRYDLDMKNFIGKKIEEVNKESIINTTNSTLEGSYAGGLVINNIQGKTEQNAYTGKNLFTFPNVYYNGTGLNITKSTDGTYLLNGTSKNNEIRFYDGYDSKNKNLIVPNGSYKVIATVNGNNIDTYATLSNGETYTSHFGTGFDVTEGFGIASIAVRVPVDETYTNGVLKIMVCKQSEDDVWEPYVGGMPSPNPSYPQEIKSVKGKNLLDCRGLTEQTTNRVTFTPVYDNNGNLLYVNANGTATENTIFELRTEPIDKTDAYILNGCPSGGSTTSYRISYSEWDASWNWLTASIDTGNGVLLTHNDNVGNASFKIEIYGGTVCDNLKFYPMIREASIIDNTYVPYGLLRFKTQGINQFDISAPTRENEILNPDGTFSTNSGFNSYRLKLTDTITISYEKDVNFDVFRYGLEIDGVITRYTISGTELTIQKDSADAVWISIAKTNAQKNIMINSGTIALPYQPYQSSEITLSEPIELNGFNGVYDVLTSYGVTRRFAKVVFDGSSDENWGFYENNGVGWLINQDLISTEKIPTTQDIVPNVLCSMAKVVSRNDLLNSKDSFAVSINGNLNIYNDYTSADDWRAFLQSNPMTVIYELATPVVEELPTTDKIALNTFKTFDGTTYIETDSEVQPIFDVDYGCSQVGAIALENHNNIEINKNDFGIEITQAEYNALSAEEKNKGTYWITDYSGSGSSSINALTSDDVVDNLASTATNLPLSANMGKELNTKISTKLSLAEIISNKNINANSVTTYTLDKVPQVMYFHINKGKHALYTLSALMNVYGRAVADDIQIDFTYNQNTKLLTVTCNIACNMSIYGLVM